MMCTMGWTDGPAAPLDRRPRRPRLIGSMPGAITRACRHPPTDPGRPRTDCGGRPSGTVRCHRTPIGQVICTAIVYAVIVRQRLFEQPVFEDDVLDVGGPEQGGLRGEQPRQPGVLVHARADTPADHLEVPVAELLGDVVAEPLEGRRDQVGRGADVDDEVDARD